MPALFFAGYLSAGRFKVAPIFRSIPVDLTLAFALAVVVVATARWLRSGARIPAGTWLVAALFGSLTIAAFGIPLSPYGREKVLFMLTLTLLATAAPLVLFTTTRDVRSFVVAMAVVGVLVAAATLIWGDPGGIEVRAAAFGISPIGSATSAGIALVVVVTAVMWRALRWDAGLVLTVLLAGAMIASGSRGPIAAALVATVFMLLLSVRGGSRATRVFVIVATVLVAGVIGLSASPERIDARFVGAFTSADTSSRLRLTYLQASWSEIIDHPEGQGWGAFEDVIPGGPVEGAYPHNILAEVFLEAGWLPGLVLIAVFGFAAYQVIRLPASVERTVILAALVFFGVAAMFSSDINDNRSLFAVLGVALAWAGKPTQPLPAPWRSRPR